MTPLNLYCSMRVDHVPERSLLSFGFLSALLVLAVVLARPMSATPPSRAEIISEIVMARGPLWLPATHRPEFPRERNASFRSGPASPRVASAVSCGPAGGSRRLS